MPNLKTGNNEVRGVRGWLAFFLVVLMFFVLRSVSVGTLAISRSFSYEEFQEFPRILRLLQFCSQCLFYIGVTVFILYTTYSIIRLRSNAVSLAKMTLLLIAAEVAFWTLFPLISSYIFGREVWVYYLFRNVSLLLLVLFFNFIWISYLTHSKRVNNTYPKIARVTSPVDKIIFSLLFAFLVVSYGSTFIGYALLENKIGQPQRKLLKNEYSDGRIYFIKPRELEIKKIREGKDSISFQLFSKEGKILFTVASHVKEATDPKDHQQFFEQRYQRGYDIFHKGNLGAAYDLDRPGLLKDELNITNNGVEYHERTVRLKGKEGDQAKEDFILGIIFLFDQGTDRIAQFIYTAPFMRSDEVNGYKKAVLDSIRFY